MELPMAAPRSVECRPIAVLQNDLNILDAVEIDAGILPDADHETPVERAALKFRAHVLIDEIAIRRRKRIREIALGRDPARCRIAS